MRYAALLILLPSLLFSSCSLFSNASPEEESAILHYPDPDPEINALIEAHRDSLREVYGRPIAEIEDTLRFEKPEGELTNLVSDALRFRAARELRRFVHIGIVNESSFKLYFLPGELTLKDVYDFMPYQNHLVVLEVDGSGVRDLVKEVASYGGAPISGVRFSIGENGEAMGILVDAEVLRENERYLIATTSFLADGNGPFQALWDSDSRTDLYHVGIRELYADYFRNSYQLRAERDGRIRR
jgi:2',3'-cyclic-nucleotide 2'-phosphodiesterase (5'-nucleotidase family)